MAGQVPAGGGRLAGEPTRLPDAIRFLLVTRRPRLRLRPRRIIWACTLCLAVVIAVVAGMHLGPGLRAASGDGIHGEWIAQRCVSDRGSCVWYGEFVRPDGTIVLPWVSYTGGLSGVHPGWITPALDSGAGDEVYPVHGSDRWVHDVVGLAGSVAVIAALLARACLVRRRRPRGRGRLLTDLY